MGEGSGEVKGKRENHPLRERRFCHRKWAVDRLRGPLLS
jgi:hypothetical protein